MTLDEEIPINNASDDPNFPLNLFFAFRQQSGCLALMNEYICGWKQAQIAQNTME